ncbi:MAG: hypothetical protein FXV80_05900 [Candidatus Thioglobus sp.]|nr:MAG: hypothetical protein FXV80_05900 [Candidatus Thioglobus sp.]
MQNSNIITINTNTNTQPKGTSMLNNTLRKLKQLFIFSALTLSLNVSAVDAQAFNKEAYLDLSKPYSYNWNNKTATKRKESQARKIFKQLATESAKTARQTLGNTDSDNTSEFGKKFKKSLKKSLKSQAVSKTQGYINSKANEFANKFGQGRTEISISGIDSEAINYHIRTIQPLSSLNKNQDLIFIQAQLASGADKGDRRETLNLGIGYRKLLEQGQSIAGINLFTDYESKSQHKRASIGVEYQRSNFTANVNSYFSLSDKTIVNGKSEEVQDGFDVRLTGQVPYLPWAKIRATQYYWKGKQGANISGNVLGFETQISGSTRLEVGSSKNNNSDRSTYARLSVLLPVENDKLTNFIVDDKPFKSSSKMQLSELKWVERSNVIRVEKENNNGDIITVGSFKGAVDDATCSITNNNKVVKKDLKTKNGTISTLLTLKKGLVVVACYDGTYTDEATSHNSHRRSSSHKTSPNYASCHNLYRRRTKIIC